MQWPQLQLMSEQSKMVPPVSVSPGPLQFRWELRLATRSPTLEPAVVAVKMSMAAACPVTHSLVLTVGTPTLYPF